MPACSRTPRCLVMAWRVSFESRERSEIELGWPEQRRATRASRVLSPSAAKTQAFALGLAVKRKQKKRDKTHKEQQQNRPATDETPDRLGAPVGRNAFKAG